MQISLSRLHFPIRSLGPGDRIGIWFQGCSIHCPGCISRDTWEVGVGVTTVDSVLTAVKTWLPEAQGLTISGGEPFDQPEALEYLLRGWRALSNGSVLLFTGYEFPRVGEWLEQRPGLVDAVVAGPYLRDASQTLALRGSDNQTLHILTEAGAVVAGYDRLLTPEDRRLDVMFDERGDAWFAGIPAGDMMPKLRALLRANGDRAVTSDQAGAPSPR